MIKFDIYVQQRDNPLGHVIDYATIMYAMSAEENSSGTAVILDTEDWSKTRGSTYIVRAIVTIHHPGVLVGTPEEIRCGLRYSVAKALIRRNLAMINDSGRLQWC